MITIYTDGSCYPNPGPGGWAAIIDKEEITGGEKNTTNNRMEITAVLRSLQHVPVNSELIVYSDSQYVVKGIGCNGNGWIVGWKNKNWIRPNWNMSRNRPVKNIDLWKEIDKIVRVHKSIEMRWVRGHNNDPLNEQCDALANKARQFWSNNPDQIT